MTFIVRIDFKTSFVIAGSKNKITKETKIEAKPRGDFLTMNYSLLIVAPTFVYDGFSFCLWMNLMWSE
jgi:hypothetical protein